MIYPDLPNIADRLKWSRKLKGWTQLQLAEAIKLSQQAVEQVENGRTKKPTFLVEASRALDVDYDWLAKGILPQRNHEYSISQPNIVPLMATDKVPVYGYVAGSTDRVAINEGRIIGMRDRGPALAYARDGFYVTVIGDSMEPRLRPGEFVAVNPSLPPLKGDECVVQFRNGEAVVKTFIGMAEKELMVSQYNPPKKLTFDMHEVLSVYPVVAIEKGR